MIAWSNRFEDKKKFKGYLRLLKARFKFYDYYLPRFSFKRGIYFEQRPGYQQRITFLRNRHAGKRCFIICNGPSLADLDLSKLKGEITIGCNGIYQNFADMGFFTNYLVYEDIEQTEIRGDDIYGIKGPLKLASINNGYAFKADKHTYFFNTPRFRNQLYYWEELYPQFSTDFASIVHLGSTVTYIMIQLAFHLGCNQVYIIGLDHNYGDLPKHFPPGKITITEENLELVQKCHYSKDYYKVGDVIGVPYVEMQEKAYNKAAEVFKAENREIYNASSKTCLDVFPRTSYEDLFSQ